MYAMGCDAKLNIVRIELGEKVQLCDRNSNGNRPTNKQKVEGKQEKWLWTMEKKEIAPFKKDIDFIYIYFCITRM